MKWNNQKLSLSILTLWIASFVLSDESWPESKDADFLSKEPIPVPSFYAKALKNLMMSWPTINADSYPSDEVNVTRIKTPGNEFAIGLKATMRIHAPLERVEQTLDDKEHYMALFPSFEDIRVIAKDACSILTFWEKSIPIFFIPNVKYALLFTKEKASVERISYQTRLRYSNYVKYDDGLLVIQKDPKQNNQTLYTEYVFYDANWGLVKTLFPSKIWKNGIEGIVQSDFTLRLRAEHPDWEVQKVVAKTKEHFSQARLPEILGNSSDYNPFLTQNVANDKIKAESNH